MEKKILPQCEWSIKVLWPISYRAREYWRPNCFSFCLIHITGAPCFSDSALTPIPLSIFRSLSHLHRYHIFRTLLTHSRHSLFFWALIHPKCEFFTKFHLILIFGRLFRTLPLPRCRPRHFQSHFHSQCIFWILLHTHLRPRSHSESFLMLPF